jgi:hypothetical protein
MYLRGSLLVPDRNDAGQRPDIRGELLCEPRGARVTFRSPASRTLATSSAAWPPARTFAAASARYRASQPLTVLPAAVFKVSGHWSDSP